MKKLFLALVLFLGPTAPALFSDEVTTAPETPPSQEPLVEALLGIPIGSYIEGIMGAADYAKKSGSSVTFLLAIYLDTQVYLGEMAKLTFKAAYQTYNFQVHILRPTLGFNLRPFEKTDLKGLYFPLYSGGRWRSDTGALGISLSTGIGYRFSLFGYSIDSFFAIAGMNYALDKNTFGFANPWDQIGLGAGMNP